MRGLGVNKKILRDKQRQEDEEYVKELKNKL